MSWQGWAQIVVFLALLVAAVKPLGAYMARVYEGEAASSREGPRVARAARLPPLRRARATPRSAR